jgi:hypothetical protein
MEDRIGTMMIVQSLQEIRDQLRAMHAELQQLNQSSRPATEDRQRREPSAVTAFPGARRTKPSS